MLIFVESNREPREKEPKTLGERANPSRLRDLSENTVVSFSPLSTIMTSITLESRTIRK